VFFLFYCKFFKDLRNFNDQEKEKRKHELDSRKNGIVFVHIRLFYYQRTRCRLMDRVLRFLGLTETTVKLNLIIPSSSAPLTCPSLKRKFGGVFGPECSFKVLFRECEPFIERCYEFQTGLHHCLRKVLAVFLG